MAGSAAGYRLEGTYLEACNCDVVCPCGAGEAPDKGTCEQLYAYHIDRGQIRGVDVSDLTFLLVGRSEGKVLEGNLHEAFFIDQRASADQREALLDAFEGRLGGPLAELANLIQERLGVHDAPIDFDTENGHTRLTVGSQVDANVEMHEPDAGARDELAKRRAPLGSPSQVGTTAGLKVDVPEDGIAFQLDGTNAVRARFSFEA